MRQHAPSGELWAIARFPGIQKHESHGEFRGEAQGGLERQVRLVLGGQQRSVTRGGSLRVEGQMGLQAVFAARERFVFVDVDFKRVLCAQPRNCEDQKPQPMG